MASKRRGCYYCFETLDPRDKQSELGTFVECSNCNAAFHATCWHDSGRCLRCGGNQEQPVQIPRPASLRVVTKTRAIPIKPSIVVHVRDGGELVSTHRGRERSLYVGQMARAIILALFFTAVATLIGVFAYRISQLESITAEIVMDAVFKESLPRTRIFVGAFTVGVVCVFMFYRHPYSTGSGETENIRDSRRARRLTYLLAGIVTTIGINIVLFDFTPQEMVDLDIDLYPFRETLYAQGATALIVLLLTPLYKSLAPIKSLPKASHSSILTNLYGLARLLFVTLFLSLCVVYLSTRELPLSLNRPRLAEISLGFLTITLTLPMVGAFVSGIGVAAILYWPPKFRQVQWRLGILRLTVVTLCVISIGLMYRADVHSEWFLNIIMISCVAMLAATPLQRVLG